MPLDGSLNHVNLYPVAYRGGWFVVGTGIGDQKRDSSGPKFSSAVWSAGSKRTSSAPACIPITLTKRG